VTESRKYWKRLERRNYITSTVRFGNKEGPRDLGLATHGTRSLLVLRRTGTPVLGSSWRFWDRPLRLLATMSMSMGGMDMTSSGPFKPTNQRIALSYWYSIAGVVGLLTCNRIYRALESRRRRQAHQNISRRAPSQPQGMLQQTYATVTATLRELSYPQPILFTGKFSKYFTPLPVGKWLVLAVYWTVLLCFLWTNTILAPSSPIYGYKWEIIGFRAAWVSVTQIPFIYLLSCKFNPISLLTGISYERFNWLHRWAARTVFLTVAVHWSFFFTEWSLAGFVKMEFEMMPMVKYGFGAWSTLGWMILSGFGFFRNLSYEVFVAQHICAAATLLWLLYVHVPAYARYNIYMAIGFVAFDWVSRIVWALLRNTHLLDSVRSGAPGYSASLEALPGDIVRITIGDAAFRWKAGQHAYITIPRLRPLELHPFTIANACQNSTDAPARPLIMIVKAHSGFSKALHKAALRSDTSERTYRGFLTGPWGSPPDLHHYDSVVLIATSTGASFTTPLLQELVRRPGCVSKAVLHWIIRSKDHLNWYKRDLLALAEDAQSGPLKLQIVVHVTTSRQGRPVTEAPTQAKTVITSSMCAVDSNSESISSSGSVMSLSDEKAPLSSQYDESRQASSTLTVHSGVRPSVESMIRPAVEGALGETAVVVCGGVAITAQTRTFVASLSDERAVHKGSGAQGIYLFSETYGW